MMPSTSPLLPGLEDLKPTPALLNSLLEELDYTNAMAAEVGGTTHQTIYRWVSGESPIQRGVFRLFLILCYLKRGQAMIRMSWSTPEEASDVEEDVGRVHAAVSGGTVGVDGAGYDDTDAINYPRSERSAKP